MGVLGVCLVNNTLFCIRDNCSQACTIHPSNEPFASKTSNIPGALRARSVMMGWKWHLTPQPFSNNDPSALPMLRQRSATRLGVDWDEKGTGRSMLCIPACQELLFPAISLSQSGRRPEHAHRVRHRPHILSLSLPHPHHCLSACVCCHSLVTRTHTW